MWVLWKPSGRFHQASSSVLFLRRSHPWPRFGDSLAGRFSSRRRSCAPQVSSGSSRCLSFIFWLCLSRPATQCCVSRGHGTSGRHDWAWTLTHIPPRLSTWSLACSSQSNGRLLAPALAWLWSSCSRSQDLWGGSALSWSVMRSQQALHLSEPVLLPLTAACARACREARGWLLCASSSALAQPIVTLRLLSARL